MNTNFVPTFCVWKYYLMNILNMENVIYLYSLSGTYHHFWKTIRGMRRQTNPKILDYQKEGGGGQFPKSWKSFSAGGGGGGGGRETKYTHIPVLSFYCSLPDFHINFFYITLKEGGGISIIAHFFVFKCRFKIVCCDEKL